MFWKRQKVFFITFICIWIIFPMLCWAANMQVEVTVDKTEVALDDTLVLSITILGQGDTSRMVLPEIQGFQSRYLGPSMSVQTINGVTNKKVSYRYIMTPKKIGRFVIPSFQLKSGSEQMISKAIAITIVEETQATQSIKKKLMLDLAFPEQETFYLGEEIPVIVRLIIQEVSLSDISYPDLDSDQYTYRPIEKYNQFEKVIRGLKYDVVEFPTVIYPRKTGEISFGPAILKASVPTQSTRHNSAFGAFFDFVEKKPIRLMSSKVVKTVKALPEDEAQEDFSGGVGVFRFHVSVSPAEVSVGDPVTVRAFVSGVGNLKIIQMPKYVETEDFKTYEPQITTTEKQKILEQVIVPRRSDLKEIPPITFRYFDTKEGVYKAITQGPFPIIVNQGEAREQSSDFIPITVEKKQDIIGKDLIYIKENMGDVFSREEYYSRHGIFKVIFVLLSIFYTTCLFFILRQKRFQTDKIFSQKFHAPRKAKKGILKAKSLLHDENLQDFYDCVHHTLYAYFTYKFRLKDQVHSIEELERVFQKKKVSDTIVQDVKILFEVCEQVRYASAGLDISKAEDHLKQCERIIDHLERKIR